MKPYTWEDALAAIREGTQTIPTTPDGVPLVVVNAQYYELMQMMEALTTGYNALVARATEDQRRIERIRKLAEAHFPASQRNTYRWVRMEERPPEKSGEYYTYGTNLGVYSMGYSAEHKLWNTRDGRTEEEAMATAIFGVTHWCELPAAPIDEAPAADEEG